MDDSELTIHQCLLGNYGIRGSLLRLPGENLNYLVTTVEGDRYILKIVDEDMPAEVVEMEYAVIEHALSKGFDYQLPEIIKNQQGDIESGIEIRPNASNRSRLLTFVDGKQLDSLSDISIKMRFDLGKMLARFNRSLEDFEHPAAHRNHRWNLAEADQHRSKISLFKDREKQQLLGWAFDRFEHHAKPVLPELPHQLIHGDAHGENVLIQGERISGLVDFGDCCFNPVICELAICLPYMMMGKADPLEVAADIVAGYHSEKPVSNRERSVLFTLICARLAVSLCIAEKRRLIDPDHPNWFGESDEAEVLLSVLFQLAKEAEKAFFL
jgi:Ser/Thr protein kinase RdoA (MazF antagonist)